MAMTLTLTGMTRVIVLICLTLVRIIEVCGG